MSNDVGIAIAWRRLVAGGALVVAGICGLGAQAGVAQGAPGAASYTEDFSVADRFRSDCAAESGLKVFPKLGLSSAGPQGGDVIYDLQKILPGWTKDSIVVLTYEGGGGDVGNQMIGVHCDSGPSTDQLAEFSKAAYGKAVVVRDRYLRFRIAWQQTAGPEYGFLKSFSVRFGTLADIPIPIAFTLDKPGVVTLVIDDAQGNRVRNLISETPFEAGKHVVDWDGCDDHTPKRVSQQPVFTFNGNPVGPGRYTVRGIVRDPVKLRYEMPVYTAGNPPWDTPDGRGGWLQDYVPPTAVVGLSDKMLVGSPVGEAFGVVWTDLEGQRLGGLRGVSAGGGWAGAELLARDNGERADASVFAYVANNWGKTFEIEALTQTLPVGAYNGGVRTMSMCLWGAGRKVYQPEEGNRISGLAARDRMVVAAIGNKNKLLVIQDKNMPGFGLRHGNPIVPDNRSGTKVAEVPIEAPRGLAVTPNGGHLLAISGTKVVRFPFPPQDQPAVVVSQGLEEPAHLAVDTTGNIYVSDQGTHQVKVFSADGKPLRTIGKPGGPQLGPYDEQRMANPAGLAISADGRLWVAENSEFPRRVSIWTLDGKFAKALYGNCNYGGGGIIDTGNAGRGYVSQGGGTLQLRLGHEKAASEVEAILSLPGRGIRPPGVAYHVGYNRVMGFAVYRGGRRYLSNAYCTAAGGGSHIDNSISIWKAGGDGIAVMVSSLGPAERWDILHKPEFDARLPQGVTRDGGRYSKLVLYAWADLNGNGAVDAAEVQLLSQPEWGGSRSPTAFTLSEDMAIVDCLGNRYRPTRFTEGGAPVFDLTVHDNIFSGARTTETSGGGQVIDGGDGWAVTTWSPDGFPAGYVAGAKGGRLRWLYPAVSIGNHAGYESPPPSKPGQMIAISSLAGPAFTPRGSKERLWPVVGLKGNVYVLTTDGMFVATLFKDYRQAKPGPAEAERGALLNDMSFGDDAWSTTLTKASDGNVYVVGGHDSTWVTRVDGLETVRRLPESEVVATEERQAAALTVGAVTPASHPQFPVETLADGRKRFVYQADFQKDKKAVDAVSSGTFADRGLAETHTSGIYGAPTVFKFAAPGDLETIEATAVYFNSVDAAPHAYDIHYSFDGREYKPLVEKTSAQPGDVKLDGKNEAPQGTRRVWIKFAGIGNPRLTLKQVGVTLTYRETQ